MTKALVQCLDVHGRPLDTAVPIEARLTVDWLRPTLEQAGWSADVAAQYEVVYDSSPLAPMWDLTFELSGTAKRTKALMRVMFGQEFTARHRRYEKHRALVARNGSKPRRYRHGRVGVR